MICKGFTRMVLSIWAMTAISLYIRIQVNILGRHLYIDTARDLGGFQPVRTVYFLFIALNSCIYLKVEFYNIIYAGRC